MRIWSCLTLDPRRFEPLMSPSMQCSSECKWKIAISMCDWLFCDFPSPKWRALRQSLLMQNWENVWKLKSELRRICRNVICTHIQSPGMPDKPRIIQCYCPLQCPFYVHVQLKWKGFSVAANLHQQHVFHHRWSRGSDFLQYFLGLIYEFRPCTSPPCHNIICIRFRLVIRTCFHGQQPLLCVPIHTITLQIMFCFDDSHPVPTRQWISGWTRTSTSTTSTGLRNNSLWTMAISTSFGGR